MATKPLQAVDSQSIFHYLYALVAMILLLLVFFTVFMLWRLDQVTKYEQKLSLYHQATTINLDVLINELNILETHLTQQHDRYSDVRDATPNIEKDISDHLFTIEDRINKTLDAEKQFYTPEFETTVKRLYQRFIILKQVLQNATQKTRLSDKWHVIGAPLAETAEQLRRFHKRDSSRLSTELKLGHQRNIWIGLGLAASMVLIGAIITIKMTRNIRKLIGLQLASAGQFKSILESTPDAIIIANQQGDIILVNAHTRQLFGYPQEELIGSSTSLLVPESLQADKCGFFRKYLNRPHLLAKNDKQEITAKRKDGHEFPAEISFSIMQSGDDGQLITAALRDISSRKRNEHAMLYLARSGTNLSHENDFYTNCVQSLAKAYNANYVFIGLLPKKDPEYIRTIAAYSHGHIVDNFQYDLKHSPCKDVIKNKKQMITHGTMAHYPKDKLLQKMAIEGFFGAPLISNNGKVFGLVVIAHSTPLVIDHWAELLLDVYAVRIADELKKKEIQDELSEQRELLEVLVGERTADLENSNLELRSALKELESFSYSVSHDLRSPLRAIDGYSNILIEDYEDQLDSTAQDHLKRIRSASQRMGILIDGLLDLTRIKVQALQLDDLDLSMMAREVAQSLSDSDPSRQVQWIIEDKIVCKADSALIHILIQNLFENAWKYTSRKAEARIEFGVSQHHNEPTYFVADNGIGFDMQYATKLFKTFHRLHTDEDGFTGMGIGLATVYRIIERHNGRVWAEAAINKGARFYFTLNKEPIQTVT